MNRGELEKQDAKSGAREGVTWDAICLDNNLLMKELVSRRLEPNGPTNSWNIVGVEVSARVASVAASKEEYRYIFLGPTWRADFRAVYGSDQKLNYKSSRILWTMYRNVRPRDCDGAICRRDLHDWLVSALSDDEDTNLGR